MIDLLHIIADIEADKRARGIEPAHALKAEIMNAAQRTITDELHQLYKEGKIERIETVNSYAVRIKKQ